MLYVRIDKKTGIRSIPRKDPETEAMLDKSFERLHPGALQWKGKGSAKVSAKAEASVEKAPAPAPEPKVKKKD